MPQLRREHGITIRNRWPCHSSVVTRRSKNLHYLYSCLCQVFTQLLKLTFAIEVHVGKFASTCRCKLNGAREAAQSIDHVVGIWLSGHEPNQDQGILDPWPDRVSQPGTCENALLMVYGTGEFPLKVQWLIGREFVQASLATLALLHPLGRPGNPRGFPPQAPLVHKLPSRVAR